MSSLSDILSVLIGLVTVFLLLSIIVSYLMELLASVFNLRSKNLADAVQLLLEPSTDALDGVRKLKDNYKAAQNIWDASGTAGLAAEEFKARLTRQLNENFLKAFYAHPAIASLSRPGSLPSYIPSKTFAAVVWDLLCKAGSGQTTAPEVALESVKEGIRSLSDESLKTALLPLVESVEAAERTEAEKIALARENLEGWFNATMQRATGWYRRKSVWISLAVGIFIAVLFNADTIGFYQTLWRESSAREIVSAVAVASLQSGTMFSSDEALTALRELPLPLGWNGRLADNNPQTPSNPQELPVLAGEIAVKLLGLLITGLAISQGSGIWFDTLGKLINLRNSGTRPEEMTAGASRPK